MVFQHSRPLHRQTVLENIKLALLPDKLTRLLADPADRSARPRHRRARRADRSARPPAGDAALRRSSQDRDCQGDRARPRGAADRRAVCRADAEGDRRILATDRRAARRRTRDPAGGSQRQERGAAGRSGARDVCRRAHRGRLGGSRHEQRDRAPRLSRRRQHRDRGAAGVLVRRQDAIPRGPEHQRPLRQGAGAGGCLHPRPYRRVRLGGGTERRRQDDAVQRDLRPGALFGRDPSDRPLAAQPVGGARRPQRHRAGARRPRALRRHERAREPRSRRPSSDAGRARHADRLALSSCFRSCAPARARRRAPCPAASSRC